MTQYEYLAIMVVAKDYTNDMDRFFKWLEEYPRFADGELEAIEIELSFLAYNVAYAGIHYENI